MFGVLCVQLYLPVLIMGRAKISSEFPKCPVALKSVWFTDVAEMGRSVSGSVQLSSRYHARGMQLLITSSLPVL